MKGRVFDIRFTKPFLEKEYWTNQKSIGLIAEENNVSPSVIRKHLLYFGIRIRTRSESQSLAESSGRRKNPTRGRKRRPDEIKHIAQGVSQSYWDKPPKDREKIAEHLRNQYRNMSDEQRETFFKKSNEAIKDTVRYGSNLEKYICDNLRSNGEIVQAQTQCVISNENMRLDILLPQKQLVIEVDGPTHLRAVYSEESYLRKKELDARKNALLIEAGYKIIRVGAEKADSIPKREAYYNLVLEAIDKLEKSGDNIIYVGDYTSKK